MIGTCSICLVEISIDEESFVETCMHHFCFSCIVKWTQTEVAKSRSPRCPLCKQTYSSVIYDCQDVAFRRWNIDGSSAPGSVDDGFALTVPHRRRRMRYSEPSNYERIDIYRNALIPVQRLRSPETASWLRRELQALLLYEDTAMIEQHCIGALVASCTQRRYGNAPLTLAAGKAIEVLESAIKTFVDVPCHARLFGEHTVRFLVSGLTVNAYDELQSSFEQGGSAS